MPELPEMENYRRLLLAHIGQRQVTQVEVHRDKTVNVPVVEFVQSVSGKRVIDITRRAKHILLWLDSGNILLLHLMLGGWVTYTKPGETSEHKSQVILSFQGDALHFHGLRLGYLHLLSAHQAQAKLADLGPEPLDPSFTLPAFAHRLRRRRGVLKTTLVDQKFLSGIGNCYSDEICFDAGIRPLRKIADLTDPEVEQLFNSMANVLRAAILYGGYMEYPFSSDDQLTGGYDDRCRVYDRGGESCFECGRPITKTLLNRRKVFYCEHCQK